MPLSLQSVFLTLHVINVKAIKLFEKHHQNMVKRRITASYPVEGALDCEKLCLEMEDSCAAVNVIYTNRRYVCDVMTELPYNDEGVPKLVTSNTKGKLIDKISEYHFSMRILIKTP